MGAIGIEATRNVDTGIGDWHVVWDMIRKIIDLRHPVRCSLHTSVADPAIELEKVRPRFQRVCEGSFFDSQLWAGIDEEHKNLLRRNASGADQVFVFNLVGSFRRSVKPSYPAPW